MMQRSIAAMTAAVFLGSTAFAFAADMTVKARAPVVALPSWTGFYGGVNVGGTFGDGSFATTGTPVSFNPAGLLAGAPATMNALAAVLNSNASRSGSQFIGGGQFGYNFQLTPAWIAGFEADIQGLAGNGRTSTVATASSFAPFGFPANAYGANSTFTERLDYLGTVRARVGYLATPSLLTYVTGGLAYGGANVGSTFNIQETFPGAFATVTPPIFGATSTSKTAAGWTIGGGLEWMFGSKWSAKVEYLYYDLGSVTASIPLTQIINNPPFINTPWATALAQTSTRFDGSIVRFGVNYHLN